MQSASSYSGHTGSSLIESTVEEAEVEFVGATAQLTLGRRSDSQIYRHCKDA